MAEQRSGLDVNTLESWLWEAACVIRGPIDAPKFKDYILPLIFLKRILERSNWTLEMAWVKIKENLDSSYGSEIQSRLF